MVETRRVVIAGGSGALGQRLGADLLERGVEVVVLSRSPRAGARIREVGWDGENLGDWVAELDVEGTALVNLAGKLVDCRPTPANVAELTRSRVTPTRLLARAAEGLDHPLTHWLQASSTAIWGDAGETWCTESTPLPDPGLPQMTGVARPWEDAAAGVRCEHQVVLRTSLVLDPDAPVLQRLAGLTRWGLGGRIGDGRQWISWIHLDDWLSVARACLGLTAGLSVPGGVVVAASDHPVRNAELMAILRRTLHRPWTPPTPAPLIRVGAVLLRTDPALALTGRRCRSEVLGDLGLRLRHPHLDEALADLLGR